MLPCHYEWLLDTKNSDVFMQASVSERNRKAREYLSRSANNKAAAAASTSAAAASTSAAAASTSAAAADDDGSANGNDGEWVFL